MFYHFLYPLRDAFFGFNVFKYITFRAAAAGITAFVVSLLLGPVVIRFLLKWNLRQTIQREGFSSLYEAHAGKDKTPTMGGVLIIGAVVASTLLWGDLTNRYVWLCLITVVWLGGVGFIDDYLKLTKKNSKGLTAANKIVGQLILGLGIGVFLYLDSSFCRGVPIPFLNGWFLMPSVVGRATRRSAITGRVHLSAVAES